MVMWDVNNRGSIEEYKGILCTVFATLQFFCKSEISLKLKVKTKIKILQNSIIFPWVWTLSLWHINYLSKVTYYLH